MDRIFRPATLTSAALVVLVTLTTGYSPAHARDHIGWRRDARGQLVLRQLPRGAISDVVTPSATGSLQRLPMPVPPGETAFDRALAREREVVARQRAKQRAALEAHAEAVRKVADRNRIEAAAAEAKRRAPRSERTSPPKKRTHAKHTNANHATHRAPPEPEEVPGEGDDE